MLKTPQFRTADPVTAMIAQLNGNGSGIRSIEEGVVELGHFSLDQLIWGGNAPEWHMGYPDLGELGSYGVCDTPEQFLTKFRQMLQDDERTFVVGFTPIKKRPENKGEGGGWRWHKWGEYVGEGTPTCEYLDDEDGFENGVYVYHIYQTAGPKKERE